MMKARIWIDKIFPVIGWLQLIGGITGIGAIVRVLANTGAINGALLLIFLTGIGLYIFSIYAGKQLLRKKSVGLSVINYILQLIQWKFLGYGLSYSSGAEFLIGIKGFAVTFNASVIISSFNMSINSEGDYFVKLNILSIVVLILLLNKHRNGKDFTQAKQDSVLKWLNEG